MTDRELVARIARSAGGKGRIQAIGPRIGAGRGAGTPPAAGATGSADRRAVRWPSLIASIGVFPSVAASGTRDNLAAGRLDLHRDGFGFVRPNRPPGYRQEDIFIPPNEINGAMQGDQVLVEVEPPKPMDAGRAALCAYLSGGTQPWSASFTMRAPIVHWVTTWSPSTSA